MSRSFKRIAVIRTCALGDAVQCTPVLQQIRLDQTGSDLIFFTSANAAPLFENSHFLDKVVPLEPSWVTIPAGRRGMLRAWWEMAKHGPFDALISLEPTWVRNVGSMLVRAPVKAGLSFTGKRKPFELFTHPLRVAGDPRHTVSHASQQYLDLWSQVNGGVDRGLGYDMRHLLADVELPSLPEKPLIAIAPGTGNAFLQVSTKQWPLASFVELGAQLDASGWGVVYLGGAGDLGRLQTPPGTLNLLGKTSIPQAAAILNQAAAMCGNDSGLFHLAQSVDCPALGVFGSTNPEFTGVFRAPAAKTLRASSLPCIGCYLHECAPPVEVQALGLERPCCMHAISVLQVMHELETLARRVPSPLTP
ncbi:MAG: putative heptosyltransferase WaaQ [Verrucomicrobiaceae bacterium]|nr:putative heptosyltransferase WaaQ [Verrucomicrobiaceae bacterium]